MNNECGTDFEGQSYSLRQLVGSKKEHTPGSRQFAAREHALAAREYFQGM